MSTAIDVEQAHAQLDEKLDVETYNFEHFGASHLVGDAQRTLSGAGIPPGEVAPDFELERADGGWLRLSDLRDRPVVLHFGSIT